MWFGLVCLLLGVTRSIGGALGCTLLAQSANLKVRGFPNPCGAFIPSLSDSSFWPLVALPSEEHSHGSPPLMTASVRSHPDQKCNCIPKQPKRHVRYVDSLRIAT